MEACFPRQVKGKTLDPPLKLQMREERRKGIRGGGTSLRSVVGRADTLRSLRDLTHRCAPGPYCVAGAPCPTNAGASLGLPLASSLARVIPVKPLRRWRDLRDKPRCNSCCSGAWWNARTIIAREDGTVAQQAATGSAEADPGDEAVWLHNRANHLVHHAPLHGVHVPS